MKCIFLSILFSIINKIIIIALTALVNRQYIVILQNYSYKHLVAIEIYCKFAVDFE